MLKLYNLKFIFLSLKDFFKLKPLCLIKKYIWYFRQLNYLKKQKVNSKFLVIDYYPCLFDNLDHTPLEPTYFFQDSWGARKIFENQPAHHYDIGSSAKTIGILSQFVPTTMVDIRPIDLELENLFFKKGSILDLPFENNSIDSLSSLCVVEHIGLGRYGDPIDAFGSEKAASELQRVLALGGNLYFSVPVDSECKVYFNAHRAFTRDYVLELFSNLELIEEKYHYGRELYDHYDPDKGFGTGLFHFQKNRRIGEL